MVFRTLLTETLALYSIDSRSRTWENSECR